jgi:hypothetical protein
MSSDLAFALSIFGAYMSIVAIFGIANYVLTSLPYYKVLKRLGYSKAWLAWIPLVRYSGLLMAADLDGSNTILICGRRMSKDVVKWFPFAYLLYFVPAIGWLIVFVIKTIVIGAICRDIYMKIDNTSYDDSVVLGYLSGLSSYILIAKMWQWIYSWSKSKVIYY